MTYRTNGMYRNEAIMTIARELEFAAYSLSTTCEGYKHRTAEKKRGVKMLGREEPWVRGDCEEWEDAGEVVKVVKRVFKGLGMNKVDE
jgi:hypothetical protein